MKHITLTALVFLLLGAALSAQSNETLDTYLDQAKADTATTIWLVLLAADQLPGNAQPSDAMAAYSDPRGKLTGLNAQDPIRFGEFAYIAMEALDLPGGMMYAMIPSPRYAAREFLYRGWIPGRPKTAAELTPWEVTTSLSEILSWKEAENDL